MQIANEEMKSILAGSTILGTGGGGRYDEALSIVEDVPAVELIDVSEFPESSLCITAYGAGGLTKPAVSHDTVIRTLEEYQSLIGLVSAIVPVEIGPYSLAAAFQTANILDLPVVDGDLVGFRSVPEIFIERVTLADLNRCPLVVANEDKEMLWLDETESAFTIEKKVREFADISWSNTIVIGYPFLKSQLDRCLARSSVSYCTTLAKEIPSDFVLVNSGRVVNDAKQELNGFTVGELVIASGNTKSRVLYKNEYLVLIENSLVMATCPSLICVVDRDTGLGLNNGDENLGKEVDIWVKLAIDAWNTPEGLELFSPRSLGFDYEQVANLSRLTEATG